MPPDANNDADVVADSYVPVAEFFSDRAVFITGGTGFLGKVLVEKLLRSCPGIKVIYLLMRSKRGMDLAARLEDVINSPLFDCLRKESAQTLEKIIPINGDISEPDLGISPADQEMLSETVSIVFHSAATTKFNEPLKLAVQINLLGTKRLIELCHRMQNLQALVHVSTCYSNCDLEEVREVVYPPPYDPERIAQCTEWMDDELLDKLTPTLIGKRPNTYTFTKALAESVILNEAGNLPVTIVRPSIVIGALKDPVPGWIEGLGGPTGLAVAGGKGILRSMVLDQKKVADLIPVDIVISLMICAAWKKGTTRSNGMVVYNCGSGYRRPITWETFFKLLLESVRRYPFEDVLWYPEFRGFSNWTLNYIHTTMFQLIPAYAIDMTSRFTKKSSRMVNICFRLNKATESLRFFSTQQWRFYDNNVQELNKSLSYEDQLKFNFNVSGIDWPIYIETYIRGIRQFLLKERSESLPECRRKMKQLLWVHRLIKFLPILLLLRMDIMWTMFYLVLDFASRCLSMTPKL